MPLSERVYCVVVAFKMTEQVEQWIYIKFCIKLEHSSKETIWLIQKAFGDDAMSAAEINVWHKRFQDGQESVKSDPHSGRSATSRTPEKVERVWERVIVWLLCPRFWCRILAWNVSWQNSFHSFCYQSRRNIVLQLLIMLGERCEVPRCPLGRGLRCHCLMYNVSYIS